MVGRVKTDAVVRCDGANACLGATNLKSYHPRWGVSCRKVADSAYHRRGDGLPRIAEVERFGSHNLLVLFTIVLCNGCCLGILKQWGWSPCTVGGKKHYAPLPQCFASPVSSIVLLLTSRCAEGSMNPSSSAVNRFCQKKNSREHISAFRK